MTQHVACRERCTVSADEYETMRLQLLYELGEIDDFGNVGEIAAGEAEDVGAPVAHEAVEVAVRFDLQVDQADIVSCLAHCRRHGFEPERLESEEYAGVHQAAGMNGEHLHGLSL